LLHLGGESYADMRIWKRLLSVLWRRYRVKNQEK